MAARTKRLLTMAWTEFKVYLRDSQTVLWTLAFPVVMILLFGELFGGRAAGGSSHPHPYLTHFLPGLLALSGASVGLFSVGVQVAQYRDHGVYRRLRVTPVTTLELVLSHVLPALGLVLVNLVIVLTMGRVVYGCSPKTSFLALALASSLTYLAFACLGFALASVTRTGRAANSAVVALLMPMMLLSGVLFPPDLLSEGLRTLSACLPLTPAVDLMRGLWLGTTSLLAPETAMVAGWLALGLAVTGRLFTWD
ncbi:MAG: ABC transporter permease [Firmicutes bacterium]|nr:ABC transporter permease [Bacillota bacterium]